jgi:hypothetical protein
MKPLTIAEWEALSPARRQWRERLEELAEQSGPTRPMAPTGPRTRAPASDRYSAMAAKTPPHSSAALNRIRAATPGSRQENLELALAWLRETFSIAFARGADFPLDPECLGVPQRSARERNVPRWLWPFINCAVGSRNHAHTTRQLIGEPRSWWQGLDGQKRRPITAEERRRYRNGERP